MTYETINLASNPKAAEASADNRSIWFATVDGDIIDEPTEQDSVTHRIICDAWYPGTRQEWVAVIAAKFAEYKTDVFASSAALFLTSID
jgi:hypothetical protein